MLKFFQTKSQNKTELLPTLPAGTQTDRADTALKHRAKRYAYIMAGLFARQSLTGQLRTVQRGARHLSLGVRLHDPTRLDKALKLAEPLALHAGIEAVLAQRVAGLVTYQFELAQGFWEYYTRADVSGLAVGLAAQRKPVEFQFNPPHALVAGSTGSGKSETMKSIMLALMSTHSPTALGFIIIDPHSDYLDFANAVHLITPIVTEAEGAAQALLWANQELAHRKANNQREGRRIIIVIDEADDELALGDKQNMEIAKALAKEGRKFQMHLLVGTHKPTHTDLPGILDNLVNRFVGRVTDANISARLTGQAGLEAHKLTGQGDFIHVAGAEVERFQVAMATHHDFERLERGEVCPIRVEGPELRVLDFPTITPKANVGGRPANTVQPDTLAHYVYYHPHNISISQAHKLLDLSRGAHDLHKNFALEFMTELERLKQSAELRSVNR